jgi:rare lipoprotein A
VLLAAFVLLVVTGALISAFANRATVPLKVPKVQYGKASWYGKPFNGRPTASGEIYRMFEPTAAHKQAPLGIHAIVTNLRNGHAVRVRINDRGPYKPGRVVDLSYGAAHSLAMVDRGVVPVKVEFLPSTLPEPPSFTVQAGAYRDVYRAALVQKTLEAYYPRVWTTMIRDGKEMMYRVRLGLFPSRAEAERLARQVEQRGYASAVVSVR